MASASDDVEEYLRRSTRCQEAVSGDWALDAVGRGGHYVSLGGILEGGREVHRVCGQIGGRQMANFDIRGGGGEGACEHERDRDMGPQQAHALPRS